MTSIEITPASEIVEISPDADVVVVGYTQPGGASAGTVTGVAVNNANGLTGTVANPNTHPVITLSTTVSGLLKGNGTAVSAATPNTDYITPTGSGASLTGITESQVALNPQTVTGSYTAAANDLVLANCSSGNATVTLPTAPANGTTVAVKLFLQNVPSGNTGFFTVTANAGGSDTIGSSGATSATLTIVDESAVWVYQTTGSRWIRKWGNLSWTQVQKNTPNIFNVLAYGADPTAAVASDSAFAAATVASLGTAAPASNSRTAKGVVYAPAGTYKLTTDWGIQSSIGFQFMGDGPSATVLRASGTSFTQSVIFTDGSLDGVYTGFAVVGDGTEQVTNGIRLDWTTAASRSTSANKYSNIRIRNLKAVTLFSLEGNGSRQLDGTVLDNVVLTGSQSQGSWVNTGNWQNGFAFGNGTYANNYDHVLTGCSASNCYIGYNISCSSILLNGAQPAQNRTDFSIQTSGQTTIKNVQSQNSGQFISSPSQFSPNPVSVEDVVFKTSFAQASNLVIQLFGGPWHFKNVVASAVILSGSYVTATVSITGQSATRPCVATFDNIQFDGALTSVFTPLSNARVTVRNFSNYAPASGLYTAAAAGELFSIWNGSWVNIDQYASDLTLKAPLASPAFTGTPTAPTQTALTNNTDIATTAYADLATGVEKTRALAAEALLAPLASPALTGNPTAPTQAALNNSTRVATTAYTDTAVGVETTRATTAEALKAPLASPALTGVPTAPTAAALTNTTQVATTAYADAATGVEKTRALAAEALLAPKASPALTGVPTAPTAAALNNSTQVATTAYTDSAVTAGTVTAGAGLSKAGTVMSLKAGSNGLNDWYNVLDPTYGAVGNGTTDDTAAIQAAINAAQTAGGGTVYLPGHKTYKISSSLLISNWGVHLMGEMQGGIAGTVIAPTDQSFNWLHITSTAATRVSQIYFRCTTFTGASGGASGPSGIWVDAAQGVQFDNVGLNGCYNGFFLTGGGIYLNNCNVGCADMADTGRFCYKGSGIVGNPNGIGMTTCNAGQTGSVNGRNCDGFVLAYGYQSMSLYGCGAIGCNKALWSTTDGGGAPNFLIVEDSFTSDHNTQGILLDAGSYTILDGALVTSSFSTTTPGIQISSGYTGGPVQIINSLLSGNNGGISIAGANQVMISNTSLSNIFNANACLEVSGAAKVTATGLIAICASGCANAVQVDSGFTGALTIGEFNFTAGTNGLNVVSGATGTFQLSNGSSQHDAVLGAFPAGSSIFNVSGMTSAGVLTVPTASTGTNTTQVASTAFVKSSINAQYVVNAASNVTNTLSLSPIWYGHLGDWSGTAMPDISGNGNNAAITGTVTTVAGPPGMQAANFAASGDFAATSTFTATVPTSFSVECWFNTSALANDVAMVSGGSFAQSTFHGFNLILFTDNNIYWDWGNGTVRNRINTSGGPVTAGVNHHVVATYNGANSVLYLDGVKVANNSTFTGPMSWPSPQVNIAQSFTGIGGTPHPISIADAGVFPVAMTAQQVAERYQAGSSGQLLDVPLGNSTAGVTTGAGVFDVMAFGATGDGITDDGTAIQNAINAAQANGGGTVLFPAGKYYYTVTPQVTGSNLVLESTATAPLYGSTGGPVLMPKDFTIDGLDITSTASQITLRNLRFVPKSATGGTGGALGTCMVHVSGTLVDLDHVLMPKAYNGVHIDGGNVSLYKCTVNPLSVAQGAVSGNYCYFADGSGSGTGAFFDNCSAWTAETTPPGVTSGDADGYVFSDGYGSAVMRDCQALGTYRSIWTFNRTSRTDSSGVTVTNGSAVVLDTSAVATDLNRAVSGTGIQALSIITSVVPGVSFTMSLPANAGGTSVTLAATVGPGGLVVKGFTFDHTGTGIQLDALGFSGFFTDIIGTSSYNNPGGINVGANVVAASLQFDNILLAAGPAPLVISPTSAVAVNVTNAVFTNIGSSNAAIECTGASTVTVTGLTTQLGGSTANSVQLDSGFTGRFTMSTFDLKNGTVGLNVVAGCTGVFNLSNGQSVNDNTLGATPAGSVVANVKGMTSLGLVAPTAAQRTNSTQVATTAYTDIAVKNAFGAPATAAVIETIPRVLASGSQGPASQRLQFMSIQLPVGTVVTNLTFGTGTTAPTALAHGWYVLMDNTFKVLATTADQTTGVWTAISTLTTLPLTSPFTTTYTGLYYVGWMYQATGGSMAAASGGVLAAVGNASPMLCGISTTSTFTTPPSVGTTITTTFNGFWTLYCYTS